MKDISRHTGTLFIARLPSSSNGNPRYALKIIDEHNTGVTCVTAVDCMMVYQVKNLEGKEVEVTIGTHYNKPTLNSIKLI